MAPTFTQIENDLDLGKEQRTERLKWVLYGVGAMAFVLGNYFLQDRVVDWVVHASSLTILCYGFILYVHEIEHIRELWLWKSVVTTIPLHLAFIASLFWWDTRFPSLAHSGFQFVGVLFTAFAVELFFFLPIFEHFRSSSFSGAHNNEALPRSTGTWQSAADRMRYKLRLRPKTAERDHQAGAKITVAGEEDSDLPKEERGNHLNWSFWAVASFLLVVYLFKGISLTDIWLYILKISLFTTFCYGHLLYVEEKEHIRESWVWKAVLVTIPFHIAFLGIMIGIDKAAPYLASNAIVFVFLIWAFGWVETKLMDQIADDYQP